jgi:hypothetical protein
MRSSPPGRLGGLLDTPGNLGTERGTGLEPDGAQSALQVAQIIRYVAHGCIAFRSRPRARHSRVRAAGSLTPRTSATSAVERPLP